MCLNGVDVRLQASQLPNSPSVFKPLRSTDFRLSCQIDGSVKGLDMLRRVLRELPGCTRKRKASVAVTSFKRFDLSLSYGLEEMSSLWLSRMAQKFFGKLGNS